MHHDYDFLIIGGGMAADAAAKGIRKQGATGSIGIVGEEPTEPFPRPALSKKLWNDADFTEADAALDTAGKTGATVYLESRVVSVDPAAHVATTEGGDTFGYATLLVATGGHPRQIDGLEPSDRVIYFRTLTDYRRLRALAADKPDVVVVGGGYIGSEITAALAQHGCSVTVVHPDELLGARTFPASVSRRFHALFEDAGVQVHGGLRVQSGEQDGAAVTLHLSDGSSLRATLVVIGLGIEPAGAVLGDDVRHSEDGGIAVDERLATSAPDVYAAGDVAEYPDVILGRRRVEHVDNATTMGATAGRIMAGSEETYDHTPMFYSDVFGHGYEAVGTLDSSLETVVDERDGGATVVYYLDDDAVRGVLLWQCDSGLDEAIALLATHEGPQDPTSLIGTIA